MSFSIGAHGANKQELIATLEAKFDTEVLTVQPEHGLDKHLHFNALHAALDVLPEPGEGEEIRASINGHLSRQHAGATTPERVIGVGSGCSVSLAPRPIAPAEA